MTDTNTPPSGKPASGKDSSGKDASGRKASGPGRAPRRESRLFVAVRFIFALGFVLICLAGAVGGLIGYSYYQSVAADLPTIDGLRTYEPPVMSRVYAEDGQLIRELASERRIFVPIAAIPKLLSGAFIAAEDQNFYTHHGVDPMAIARAAATDLARLGARRRPVGASTITQQVARNMLLGSDDVSLKRKAQEAILAMRLEGAFSKDRILELYLNEIYLGQGAYGVAAAAQALFNRRLSELSPAQCAMLAALPKSPSNYNPFRFPDAALARRNWVIGRMQETGLIDAATAQAALAEPLAPAAASRPDLADGSDWFAEEVRRQLIARFGPDRAAEGGLMVTTSFNPAMQREADRALHDGLMNYDRHHSGWRGPLAHIAPSRLAAGWLAALRDIDPPASMMPDWHLAVVREVTGDAALLGVLPEDDDAPGREALLLGGQLGYPHRADKSGEITGPLNHVRDALSPGDVVMVQLSGTARLRAGKALREMPRAELRQAPLVSGALVTVDARTGRVRAMVGGWSFAASNFNRVTQAQRQPGSSFKPFVYLTALSQGISPSARFDDAPFSLGDWHPNNYEMTYGGPTPIRVALEQSLNLVTVRLAQRIGMDDVARTAIAFRLVDAMPRVLPAALGAVETTVIREAGAYASLASGGRAVMPSLIDSVMDRDGRVVWRPAGLAFGASPPDQPPVFSDPRKVLADQRSTYQLIRMLQGVVKFGTGAPVAADFPGEIAGKTGTSQDYNDAWFAGFTPDLVTIVWVGFDTPRTLGDEQTGAVVAGPIWRSYMQAVLKDAQPLSFRAPDGVDLYSWGCGRHDCIDAFKPGQEPGAGYGPAAFGKPDPGVTTAAAASGNAAAQDIPADPATQTPTGTGVDSGVGGLY